MAKDKLYVPPHFNRYQSEADYPDRVRDAVTSMRQKFNITPQCEVKAEFITVVNSDREFVDRGPYPRPIR
jgi:hypothetical protein